MLVLPNISILIPGLWGFLASTWLIDPTSYYGQGSFQLPRNWATEHVANDEICLEKCGKPRCVEDPGSLKRIGRRGRFDRMKLNPGGMVSACPDLSGTAASRSRFAYFLSAGSNDTQDNPAHTVARRIRSKSHVRHGTHFGWHSTRTW